MALPKIRIYVNDMGMAQAIEIDGHRLPGVFNVRTEHEVRGVPAVVISIRSTDIRFENADALTNDSIEGFDGERIEVQAHGDPART